MSAQVAEFVHALKLDAVPAASVEAAITLVNDTLAVAWAGTTAPGIVAARELAIAQGGREDARLWASGVRLPVSEAAFANAAAAAALDYDSVHQGSILHADAVVLPAALAVAEMTGASGRDLLAAHIAGIEIAHRLSMATPRRSGWFMSSTAGVFGAAAAAAKLLGLDVARTGHALGIALSMSGGTKAAIVERTLTKRLQTAFVARAGVQAALLASRGVTGPSQWLTGPYGWFAVYEAGSEAAVTDGLGERFVFAGTGIKKFPCCLCSHAAIDATLALVRDHALAPEDIDSMAVTISPYMAKIVGAPYAPARDPQVTAQFSVQYAVATAASKRRFTLAEIEEDVCLEPSLVARAQGIPVDTDPDWPGETAPARVTLRTRGHAPLTKRVDALPGTAANPMSAAELEGKFADCLTRGAAPLSREQAAATIRRCRSLPSMPDARTLLDATAG